MAEKLTDDQLRKALIELGEVNIGTVTASTRPIYLKKLNHLRARQKQSANGRAAKTTDKKLLGFSSDESGSEAEVVLGPGGHRWRGSVGARQASRRLRSDQQGNRAVDEVTKPKSDHSLARPMLRSRQSTNARSEPFGTDSRRFVANTTTKGRSGSRHTRRTVDSARHAYDDGDNAFTSYSPLSENKLNQSVGLQVSLADDERQSDGEYVIDGDIPDAFESSDSDLDVHQVPDYVLSDSSNRSTDVPPPGDMNSGSSGLKHVNRTGESRRTGMSYCENKSPRSRTGPPNSFTRGELPVQNHVILPKTPGMNMLIGYPFRVAHEAHSWKNSVEHHVSRFLVILFALFFIVIGVMYWNMRSISQDAELDKTDWMLCNDSHSTSQMCFTKDDVKQISSLIIDVGELLSRRAGLVECGHATNRTMTVKEVEDSLQLMDEEKKLLKKAMILIQNNSHWMVRLLTENGDLARQGDVISMMESAAPTLSVWCRLRRAVIKVFNILLMLVIVALCICAGYAALRWYWRLQEEEARNVYNLVEKIIDVLKSHYDDCQDNPNLKPYMAIPHVRDMLIPPKERRKKQALWDKAVKFLSTSESRVRVEMITIEGEEFAVWRWLQTCPNGSKVWQGQAFGEHLDGGPRKSPTPCLKIRNMFDLDVEYGDDWHVYIQDAVLEKCGPDHNILHIAVDKTSKEGCVYVKCKDEKAAGKAYKTLHGWWFDGNLLTVKYLHLERYHERFPESINCHTPLKPSNNKKLSLSQPFHHSVMECS